MKDLEKLVDEHFVKISKEQLLKNLEEMNISNYIIEDRTEIISMSDYTYEEKKYNKTNNYNFTDVTNDFYIKEKLAS